MEELRTLQVRVPKEVKRDLQVKCILNGVKVTDVLRMGIETFLEHGIWWREEESVEIDEVKRDLQNKGLWTEEEG